MSPFFRPAYPTSSSNIACPTARSFSSTWNSKGVVGTGGSSLAEANCSHVFSPLVRACIVFCSEVCIGFRLGYCNWFNQFIANLFFIFRLAPAQYASNCLLFVESPLNLWLDKGGANRRNYIPLS